MKRRGFLGVLTGAAAAIAVPELLLPKRTYFLPPAGGWDGSGDFTLEGWIKPFPFNEPSPVLFEMLRSLPEIPPLTGYYVEWIPSRLHTEDSSGIILEETNDGRWHRLRFV